MASNPSKKSLWPWVAAAAIFAITAAVLRFEGRRWWCRCGGWQLWWTDTKSPHTSQHLFDPYSFTHVLHGILFYGLFAWLFPRVPRVGRFLAALGIEALWEIVENTDFVINRYRSVTISLDYFGDSVVNSMGDILACAFGIALAPKLGFWRSAALFVIVEVCLLFWIRDCLTLNVIMLVCPLDAVKAWQMGH